MEKNKESLERYGKGERKEVGVAGGSGIFISVTLHLYRALFFGVLSLAVWQVTMVLKKATECIVTAGGKGKNNIKTYPVFEAHTLTGTFQMTIKKNSTLLMHMLCRL